MTAPTTYDPRDPNQQTALLQEHNVQVTRDEEDNLGWGLSWAQGCLSGLDQEEAPARAIAALFVHWRVNKNHPEGLTDCGQLRDAAVQYFRQ